MTWLCRLRPAEGLWRPGLMMCDQATCVIYTGMSQEAFQKCFQIHELRQALAQAPPQISRARAFKTVPRDAIDYYAILNHELDHLRRQFSNPCGFLALHLRSRLIAACRHLIFEENLKDCDIAFPLLLKFEESSWLREAISERLLLAERWMERNEQERTVLTACATLAAIRGLEQGSRINERILGDAALLRASGGRPVRPDWICTPTCSTQDR